MNATCSRPSIFRPADVARRARNASPSAEELGSAAVQLVVRQNLDALAQHPGVVQVTFRAPLHRLDARGPLGYATEQYGAYH